VVERVDRPGVREIVPIERRVEVLQARLVLGWIRICADMLRTEEAAHENAERERQGKPADEDCQPVVGYPRDHVDTGAAGSGCQ